MLKNIKIINPLKHLSKKAWIKIILILLLPFTLILNNILKNFPDFIEKYYTNSLNKYSRQILSIITGIFGFSVAEVFIILIALFVIFMLVRLIFNFKLKRLFNYILNSIVFFCVMYSLFLILWGYNYDRLPLDKISGFKIEQSTNEDLSRLCESLIDRANNLRKSVNENKEGIATINGGYKSIFNRVQEGFDKASAIYPQLKGWYGKPKPIMLSKYMSYTGITGIYVPFSGEANINLNQPDYFIPSTTAHEMAHQRGFAKEDEANYIAYVVCNMHPDADFKYSGTMLALVHSMNALYGHDPADYEILKKKYSQKVYNDLIYDDNFWAKYEGYVEKATTNLNNNYLKSNGLKDGVQSYGRVVDLLLAEYKSNGYKLRSY